MNNWVEVKTQKPPVGIEVIFFNEKWVDKDFNHNGTRAGFLNNDKAYVSSYWCDKQDEYININSSEEIFGIKDIDRVPTHWLPMPVKPNTNTFTIPDMGTIDFRYVRTKAKLSITEVGNDLGLSSSWLSQLENGKIKGPSYNTIRKLLTYYNSKI